MSRRGAPPVREPLRVVRIIARLNIGGPAIQAITLTNRLEPLGYRTTLVRGREEPDEGDMDYLADALGVRPGARADVAAQPGARRPPALVTLVRDHSARASAHRPHARGEGRNARPLGRAGAGLRPGPRPILIHTFHGHSLTGYFSPRTASIYRRIERSLSRVTPTC